MQINETKIKISTFNTPKEAGIFLRQMAPEDLAGMCDVYRDGFGGPPWNEVGKCFQCGAFLPTMSSPCNMCGSDKIGEAYPRDELANEYFPRQLETYTPGLLGIARVQRQVVGFAFMGFSELGNLVEQKYGADADGVLRSITSRTELRIGQRIGYFNEIVVAPEWQNRKVGSALSFAGTQALANELGAGTILGRSINLNLLGMVERQFPQLGLRFQAITPKEDSHKPPRTIFIGSR